MWLRLPENGQIRTRVQPGPPLIELPPGSSAVRVEKIAHGGEPSAWQWSTADVRGTRFERGGEVFFVLRPAEQRIHSPLTGWEWRRDSADQQREATRLVEELAASIAAPDHAEGEKKSARRANACSSCHEHARPANARPGEHGVANRSTDASGCYQVQNVLLSQVPLETYFPLEMNLNNPFVRFGCKSGEIRDAEPAERATCSDGSIPWGRFDVRAALAASNDQAQGLCLSRRYLYERIDEAGRQAFAQAFAECQIGTSP